MELSAECRKRSISTLVFFGRATVRVHTTITTKCHETTFVAALKRTCLNKARSSPRQSSNWPARRVDSNPGKARNPSNPSRSLVVAQHNHLCDVEVNNQAG